MSITEYIENLRRLKKLAVDRWGNLTQTETAIVDGSFEWLVENLEIKEGAFQTDDELVVKMDEFLAAVKDVIQRDKNYKSTLKNFVSDLGRITNNIKEFHSSFHGLDITTVLPVTNVQQAVIQEALNQYLDNGLNVHFVAPLRETIFRNILIGANLREVRQRLREYVLSGQDGSGKFQRYVHNTAIQAVDTYTGAINKKLNEAFKFTGYIISGSLIETSSEQCIYAVENSKSGYFTFEEWEKVLDIARNNSRARLIPGTTIKNLPLNKLHWGCRHDFTPVMKKPPSDGPTRPQPGPRPEPTEPPKPKKPREQGKKPTVAGELARVKDIFSTYKNIKIGRATTHKTLKADRLKLRVDQLQKLAAEYKISDYYLPIYETEIQFSSNSDYSGVVRKGNNGAILIEANFGHVDSGYRAQEELRKNGVIRSFSKVDKKNTEISTTTHEFGHIITTTVQKGKADVAFWDELLSIRTDYFIELNEVDPFGQPEKYNEIYLGSYASTNEREFMAEAFTEYKLSSKPSKYAKLVGQLIDKYFKR